MTKLITLTAFCLLFGWSSLAQQSEENIQHTYYYSVDHVQSENQLQEIYHSIEELKFVTKVKLNYKSEKPGIAQFIVYVSEPKRISETQEMFELTDLKKIIVDHDLQVTELKIYDN